MNPGEKFKYLCLISVAGFFTGYLNAQKAITINECYDSAIISNALAEEKDLYSEISGLKEKNISKGWLPSIDLTGSVLYNSSVVDLGPVLGSLPVPGIGNAIPPVPHDQYKVTLDVNQVIYDGGVIRSSKAMENAELKVNEKQTESDLYKLRAQVNAYYFNILLLDRQKELLENYLGVIEQKLTSVRSAVENGVLLRSDADVLNSERINILQQLSEITARKESLLRVLTDITGINMDESTVLILPETPVRYETEVVRPELQLLDMKKEQLAAGETLAKSKRMPKAYGFATLGYGNPPGSNFFIDEFDTYYILGAGIKWNIFDWNRVKNERRIIALQENIIDNRKRDLMDNIERQLDTKKTEIINLEKMIESDKELAEIRKRISDSAESQYQNGVITATEYLSILNSEKQVLINSEIHKVNLALARTEYHNLTGTKPQ